MKKILGLLAVAGLMFVAAPSQQANALSLASPAGAPAARHASGSVTTDVYWRHGHGWHHRHHHHWRRW